MTAILAATAPNIETAARMIGRGALVAFPTETVYGLGADATDERAVAAIFAAKDRPRFNPLITHFPDLETAGLMARFDDRAFALAEAFWPGPLTLVLPRLPGCRLSLLVSAGLDTVAVRVPAHRVAQELLRRAMVPIAAPSANRSGAVSPTTADHVARGFRDGLLGTILDGGPCRVGLESTVIDLSTPQATLLRPGGLAAERIEAVIGPLAVAGAETDAPRSPGMLARHYAPSRPLRLEATSALGPDEALLGFGDMAATLNLSRSGNLEEAAANLFAMLRDLDAGGWRRIAVAPIPETGIGRAINDRLRRAATPEDWNDERGPAAACRAVCDPYDEGD